MKRARAAPDAVLELTGKDIETLIDLVQTLRDSRRRIEEFLELVVADAKERASTVQSDAVVLRSISDRFSVFQKGLQRVRDRVGTLEGGLEETDLLVAMLRGNVLDQRAWLAHLGCAVDQSPPDEAVPKQ